MKARLVVKGCSQKWGVDFFETYAPVVRAESAKLLIVEAFLLDWYIDQLDVKDAYLNGNIDVPIYMKQPPGHEDSEFRDHVCRLLRALYGLKQAGRAWHKMLIKFLIAHGYKQTVKDPCVLIKTTEKGTSIILLYVDDILPLSSCLELRTYAKQLIMSRFKTRDLGPLKQFIGLEIERTPETLSFAQLDYSEQILHRFGMQNAKPNRYPLQKPAKRRQSGDNTPTKIAGGSTQQPKPGETGCILTR